MEERDRAVPLSDSLLARCYLLGELSQSDLARVDERLFSDDRFFSDVLQAEEELMEDYLESRLPDEERAHFERHFLASPSRRRSFEVTRALLRRGGRYAALPAAAPDAAALTTPGRARLRIRRWAIAASLAAAAALIVVLGKGLRERPSGSVQGDSLGDTVTLALSAGLVRGAQVVPELVLPAGTRVLRLRLDPPAVESTGYQAVLRTADGEPVWDDRDPRREQADGAAPIVLRVPAVLLEAADYVLTLQASGAGGAREDIAGYFFRVSAVSDRGRKR